MIKHLKVRSWMSYLILGVFILSIYCAIFNSPTHSVENKSVNEQVCSQPEALETEENLVQVTGSSPTEVKPIQPTFVSTYPGTGIPVTEVEETEGETRTYDFNNVGYTITNVNVREAPTLDGEIFSLCVYGTEIEYADYDDEWIVIEYNDEYAYMARDYISDTEPPSYEVYEYDGQKLTASLGTITGPSGKETYYNLPMGLCIKYMQDLGFNYEYWVRNDGCKMYGNYIMVAADTTIRPKGTILKTSLGLGMVCDHCEAAEITYGQIDLAVTW